MATFSKLRQVNSQELSCDVPFPLLSMAHSPDPSPSEVSAGSCGRELYWEAKADWNK